MVFYYSSPNRLREKANTTQFQDYKATIMTTVWYWWKSRQIDQCNRKPDIYVPKFDQLIFDKGVSTVQWRKGSLLK